MLWVFSKVLLSNTSCSIIRLRFSFLCRLKPLIGSLLNSHSSAPPLHSLHLVSTGGTACGVALRSCLHRLPPRSIRSRTVEWSRCHSGRQRWPLPYMQWCQCPLPGPGCTLSSSPLLHNLLEGSPAAPGSGGHRRWQWGLSGELQCHYLEEMTDTC